MKIKNIVLFLCLLFFGTGKSQANENQRSLFFSLGSNCEIATVLGHYNLRHLAGPLDWLLTLDYDRFLLLIENDFEGLVDEQFLTQYPDNHVINSYYNIDFRHDWTELNFEIKLPEIQSRLRRRVNRILDLKHYDGKVYFIRGAFDTSINPFLPTITKQCTKITPQDAENLKNVLQKKYPNLDFTLIIINYYEESDCEFNSNLERIMEFKVCKLNRKKREEDYKAIMEFLMTLK